MPRRLIGIAVIDAWISPMLKAHGNESATCVKGLGEGEELVMELRQEGKESKFIPLLEGQHLLPSPLARGTAFRVQKVQGGISATTVEVIG
jgi:hypothetical protein